MIKLIKQFENEYMISITGEITRIGSTKPLKAHINCQTGYACVDLWKNNKGHRKYVHRLLAEHFIPNPHNKPEVNHIDSDRNNNNINNLEWVTSSENSFHASRFGLRFYTRKMNEKEVTEILYDIIAGESYASASSRTPHGVPWLSQRVRKIAKKLKLEKQLDASLYNQKVARNRKVLAVINAS